MKKFSIIAIVILPLAAFAQGTLQSPFGVYGNLCDLINLFMTIALWIMLPVIGVTIVYAGFLMVSAQGDQKKIDLGKSTLKYALIGFAIILGSKGILSIAIGTGQAIGGDNATLQQACPF